MRYRNRTDAGLALVEPLRNAGFGESTDDRVVLGVARGGVVVAAPIAEALGARLGAVVARKLRAPRNPELAIGAVGSSGDAYVDEWLVRRLGVAAAYVAEEVDFQRNEIARRLAAYGSDVAGVIGPDVEAAVVDDGVATGATLIAALRSVRARRPRRLFCAVPVGPRDTLMQLGNEADVVVCPLRPTRFSAVGEWYADFTQTSDAEVIQLLTGR